MDKELYFQFVIHATMSPAWSLNATKKISNTSVRNSINKMII